MNVNKKLSVVFVFIFSLIIQGGFSFAQNEKEHESLEYNISVGAMLMPVFAVDGKNNPVYDLTAEELSLYLNGKLTPFELTRYEFEENQTENTNATQEKRVVFIILDAIFNSMDGFIRGKEMAIELAKKGYKNDLYIVMQITPVGGIEYITGPEPYSPQLEKKIKDIDISGSFFKDNLFVKKRTPDSVNFDLDDIRNSGWDTGMWDIHRQAKIRAEKMQYSITIQRFIHLLSQFQHALRTITKPKIVFMISEGISRKAFESEVPSFDGTTMDLHSGNQEKMVRNNDVHDSTYEPFFETALTSIDMTGNISNFHLKYLKEIARSINEGGSVLYTVNPRRASQGEIDPSSSGDMSLNFMARQSGGKYFQGTDVVEVMKNIKRNTAAYYEISFNLSGVKGKDFEIRIKSKRKGIDIHTLKHATKGNPYHLMSDIEKKIFALNVINQGTWSRMVSTVEPARIRYLASKKAKKSIHKQIEVQVPPPMKNKKADLFLIETDVKTGKNHIDIMNQTLDKETQLINLKQNTSRKTLQHLVIIEPNSPFCIYTLVK